MRPDRIIKKHALTDSQRIQYGKGKSDIISRLDGSAKAPDIKTQVPVSTELQKSIFNAPPQAVPAPAPSATDGVAATTAQGIKRAREDDSDEGEAPMEEDDAMEMSDDDD